MPKIRRLLKSEKLTIKNEGKLSLFFIGVGSAFSKIHNQTNLLIIKGDNHVLIDCGTLCPKALWKYGCPITNISNFIITHSHADHIGGLEEAALMGRYVIKKRPKLYITEEYKPFLWNHSLKGGISFGEVKDGHYLEFEDIFEIIDVDKISGSKRAMWNTNVGNLNIKLFRTKHMPDNAKSWEDSFYSYGMIIDEKIIFTSDTRFDEEIVYLLGKMYNIEWYFHDCQLFTGGVHCSIDELKSYPPEIRKKIILAHYGDNYKNFTPKKDGFYGFAKEGVYYDFD